MRVLAISDIHVDYEENLRWINNLSRFDYQNDILILGGDVSDSLVLLEKVLIVLRSCFNNVLFVPGNHDLWVFRSNISDSLAKFQLIQTIAQNCGVSMSPLGFSSILIVPLLGWYDYSFGQPLTETHLTWRDFVACKWPDDWKESAITEYFIAMNQSFLKLNKANIRSVISFSHFLPRLDLLPSFIPPNKSYLNPVLGTTLLEKQIRSLNSNIHIYGHSHVNTEVKKEGTRYINNAFGYPHEIRITAKKLKCILEL